VEMSTCRKGASGPTTNPLNRRVEDASPECYRGSIEKIPRTWALRQLRDDVVLLSGHHVLARFCNTQNIGSPYLTGPADFPSGRIQQTKFTDKPTTLCKTGDILVTVKGAGSGTLIVADDEYCISRQLMAIRPGTWDPRFLFFSLLENASRFREAATGLIPGLSRRDILDQALPIPRHTSEQRAIANALSDVERLLGALEAMIAKKRAVKQAAVQQLLTGTTRLPGFSEEWETKRLAEVGYFLKGSGVRRDDATSGPLACVRYGEIYTTHHNYIRAFHSRISPELSATATRLEFGDLLFAGSGETKEEIGKCVAFVLDVEAYAGGDIVILRPSGVDSLFLGYALNAHDVARQKASLGQGDAVVHISSSALAQVSVRLPAVREQTAIARVFFDMDAEIAALEARRDKTRAIKEGMMQQLLTGRVRLVPPDSAAA